MEEPFNKIEQIELEYEKRGKRYADWQKEKYAVRVENYELRVRTVEDGYIIKARNGNSII